MASIVVLALAGGAPHAPASAQTGPSTREIWPIVPGAAIGPVRLGMSRPEVARAHAGLPCEVTASYAGERAARLETNCGLAFQTAEGVMVGLDGSRARRAYGMPEEVTPHNTPPGTRADWWTYRGMGIAFRVVFAVEGGQLIQAIAVFGKTGTSLPPAPPGFPAP